MKLRKEQRRKAVSDSGENARQAKKASEREKHNKAYWKWF